MPPRIQTHSHQHLKGLHCLEGRWEAKDKSMGLGVWAKLPDMRSDTEGHGLLSL